MRRLWAWGIAMALMLGLAATATADPRPNFKGDGLIGGLFGSEHPADAKPGDKGKDTPPAGTAVAPPAPSPAAARAIVEREQKILQRRQDVCDKLRQIAVDTSNAELEQQADQLSQQAFDVFRQHTVGLAAIAAQDKGAEHSGAGRTVPLTRRSGADRTAGEDQ